MRVARNFLAGVTASVWSALVTLASVPIYLKYLGVEAYGLIGFFVFAQSVLQLLEFGLGPTISREVARCTAMGQAQRAAELLRTLAVIYWITSGLILVGFTIASPLIARYWLNTESMSIAAVTTAAALIGLVIAARWPLALYQGVLTGAQRLTTSSAISILMVSVANLGAIGILAFVSPTVEAYFIWQAGTAIVFSLVVKVAAWRTIGRWHRTTFNLRRLAEVWRFSAGVSLVAVSAIILIQLDKAILSNIVSLEAFGQYMLAVLVSNSLYVLVRPLFSTIYPRMSALVAAGDTDRLKQFYRYGTRLFSTTIFPLALVIALFAEDLIRLWTQDPKIASAVAPLTSLLVLGTAVNGVMHFPYALQLSHGATRLPLVINVLLIAFSAPVTVLLTLRFGVIGGAISWVVLNALYLLLGTWLTHRLLLKGIGVGWLVHDVLLPFSISAVVIGTGAWITLQQGHSYLTNLSMATLLTVAALLVNVSLNRAALAYARASLI